MLSLFIMSTKIFVGFWFGHNWLMFSGCDFNLGRKNNTVRNLCFYLRNIIKILVTVYKLDFKF